MVKKHRNWKQRMLSWVVGGRTEGTDSDKSRFRFSGVARISQKRFLLG
jgi:hypothetical protein